MNDGGPGGRTMKDAIVRGFRVFRSQQNRKRRGIAVGRNSAAQPIRNRIRHFFFCDEEGTALVEFTLTLPILVAILTGIFELGIAFNNQLSLTQAVGSGAQYLQEIRQTTTDPCRDTINTIESAAPYLISSKINLTLTMNGTQVSGNSCAGDQSDLAQGEPVTVAATYPCNISIYGVKFSSTCNLSAQVTEYEY
jgi:Flp pilus assembly protein TadG